MDTINTFRGRMIPPKAAANATSTSECTIHRWIRSGKIRAVKLSEKCTRIDGDSLADYMQSCLVSPKRSA